MRQFFLTLSIGLGCVWAWGADAHAAGPALVGWGNLFLPGLGATLRGEPARGLLEATAEIGTYTAGVIGLEQGTLTVDGTIIVPERPNGGNLSGALRGQLMQQVGMKLHMYNTFFHYQQAVLENEADPRESENPQKIYRGSAWDVMSAPFRWKNLATPWVYPVLLATTIAQVYMYQATELTAGHGSVSGGENALYAWNQLGAIPLGSSFGEEVLFRGFMQRELRGTTRSMEFSLFGQSAVAAMLHPSEIRLISFVGGIYSGMMVNQMDGELGPAIAAHFWIDVVNGLVSYWAFRRTQGAETPFAPALKAEFAIPI